jgi:tRNA 2-thiocytidine biosynthesis protein TtcA
VIKEMLQGWDKSHPGRIETMFRALCNVVPSHLADPQLFDFKNLQLGFPHGIGPAIQAMAGPLGEDDEATAGGSGVQVMEKIDILSV